MHKGLSMDGNASNAYRIDKDAPIGISYAQRPINGCKCI